MEIKTWYKSKTIWFGILQLVAAIALYFAGAIQTGEAFSLTGILTIMLRTLTNSSIK